jgi:hypothetical protein
MNQLVMHAFAPNQHCSISQDGKYIFVRAHKKANSIRQIRPAKALLSGYIMVLQPRFHV